MTAKFKLQSVLNYRCSLEDQARQQLADSLQQQSRLQEQLQLLQKGLQQLDAELKERQKQGLEITEMALFESQISHRQRLLKDLKIEIQLLERTVENQREALLQAARDKQVMEKLKEKQEREYRQELSRKERELLDEISLRSKGEMS